MKSSAKLASQKLYRRIAVCASSVVCVVTAITILSPAAQAQSKKRKGPRAIAVVRWDADSKDKALPMLVPVAILDDGKFYDASVYKAAPSPMPLLAGTVYEAQDKGEILGYFTIKSQARTKDKQNWIALGLWESATPPMDKLAESASHVEVVHGKSGEPEKTGGDNNDDRDLKKQKTTVYDENGKPMPEGTTASPAAPMGGAGDSRPTMKRSSGSPSPADPQKTPESTKPTTKKKDDDPDRPTLKRESSAKPEAPADAAKTQPQSAGEEKTASKPDETIIPADQDPNRPELKRGKPTTQTTAGGLPHAVNTDKDPDRPVIRRNSGKAADPMKEPGIPVPS